LVSDSAGILEFDLVFVPAYAGLSSLVDKRFATNCFTKSRVPEYHALLLSGGISPKGHFGLMFLCSTAELHEKPGCHGGTKNPSRAAFFVARIYWPAKAATSSLILIPAGENSH